MCVQPKPWNLQNYFFMGATVLPMRFSTSEWVWLLAFWKFSDQSNLLRGSSVEKKPRIVQVVKPLRRQQSAETDMKKFNNSILDLGNLGTSTVSFASCITWKRQWKTWIVKKNYTLFFWIAYWTLLTKLIYNLLCVILPSWQHLDCKKKNSF